MQRGKLIDDLWDTLDDKLVIVCSDMISGKTEAVDAIVDHAHIARALALLDRVGNAAADAILKGEAAVVPVEALRLMTGVAEQAVENAKVAGGMMVDDATLADLARDALAAIAAGRLDREGGR